MTARILRAVVYAGAILSTAMLVLIIGFILVNGIPNLSPTLFEWEYTSDNVSLMPALVDTVLMALFALVIAAPSASPRRCTSSSTRGPRAVSCAWCA